jgi:ubiquinone/menaquinone biosynthesis C-methylase UbiE
MSVTTELQPDQEPARWDSHVAVYEGVFEPLTNAFARHALDLLNPRPGDRVVDVGAGSGGAALMAAARGAHVLAADAFRQMVSRIRARARSPGISGRVDVARMDGMALALSDASFDAAVSVFGVILFPDAGLGMSEIARILKPGGQVAVVTWTESEKYELVARLIRAIEAVCGPRPPPSIVPAQLRFQDERAFRKLFAEAGLHVLSVGRVVEGWRLPSARWIAEKMAFAPGMAAMVGQLGSDRRRVLDSFVTELTRDQGPGEVTLSAVAQVGFAMKPG